MLLHVWIVYLRRSQEGLMLLIRQLQGLLLKLLHVKVWIAVAVILECRVSSSDCAF